MGGQGSKEKKIDDAVEKPREQHAVYKGVNGTFACAGAKWTQNDKYRRTMEDRHVVKVPLREGADDAFFGVYDGHGGARTVDVISQKLHSLLAEELSKHGEQEKIDLVWRDVYMQLDAELLKQMQDKSGSTAVTALIRYFEGKKYLHVANCGDSRAVLRRNGCAVRVSTDHNTMNAEEVTRVKEAKGFIALRRVNGTIEVSRSFGDFEFKPPRTEHEILTAAPSTHTTILTSQDDLLIMATDGIWGVIDDQLAVKLVSKTTDIEEAVNNLVTEALARGSTDNIMAIVVHLTPEASVENLHSTKENESRSETESGHETEHDTHVDSNSDTVEGAAPQNGGTSPRENKAAINFRREDSEGIEDASDNVNRSSSFSNAANDESESNEQEKLHHTKTSNSPRKISVEIASGEA